MPRRAPAKLEGGAAGNATAPWPGTPNGLRATSPPGAAPRRPAYGAAKKRLVSDEPKRVCTGKCKQYRVKKPASGGRYEAGHGRCQTCDIWIDYRGGHMRNGGPAVEDSIGWYCNCCNFRIRRNPRNAEYKQRLRYSTKDRRPGAAGDSAAAGGRSAASGRGRDGGGAASAAAAGASPAKIDLTYFNKRRAHMLRDLGRALVGHVGPELPSMPDQLVAALENEFSAGIDAIVSLALSESPNKASLIADFERTRTLLGEVPTRQNLKKAGSRFPLSAYDGEFESWGHLLDRMGYDPWYRH